MFEAKKGIKVGDKVKIMNVTKSPQFNGHKGELININSFGAWVKVDINGSTNLIYLAHNQYEALPKVLFKNDSLDFFMQQVMNSCEAYSVTDNLRRIADHYGYEAQSRQMIEEAAELTVAINKVWRKVSGTVEDQYQAAGNMIDELADVSIMLEQMIYLMDCENEVIEIREKKIKRQLERITEKK